MFPGAPLVVTGRFRGAPRGALALVARDAAGRAYREVIAAERGAGDAIRLAWARGEVRALEDQLAIEGDPEGALARRIVETSLAHGVLSRFTAFVAVDRAEVVNAGGEVHQVIQPVELPSGWAARGLAGPPVMAPAPMAAGAPVAASAALLFEATEPPSAEPAPDLAARAHQGLAPTRRSRASSGFWSGAPQPSTPGAPGAPLAPAPPPRGMGKGAGPAKRLARAATSFWSGLGGGDPLELKQAEAAPLDLAPYRARARALADRVGQDDLGAIHLALQALLEDLRSVGAPETELSGLAEQSAALAAFLAAGAPPTWPWRDGWGRRSAPSGVSGARGFIFRNGP